MIAKEALNRLKESAHALEELPASNWVDYYGEEGHLIDNETELELAIDNDFEIIQKDLDRLEILEQENESLKLTIKCQNASEEQTKLYALGLEQENQKLKKAFKVLWNNPHATFGLEEFKWNESKNIFEYEYEYYGYDYDYGGVTDCTDYVELTNEEYELLKEVLGNEKNS